MRALAPLPREAYVERRDHPDGGALQNYANTLPEPDRSVFLHDLKLFGISIGYDLRIRRKR